MASDRMLLALSSPLTVDKSAETRLVKGFMSVELPDRSEELAPAEEFNIASFMAKPTLMYNHKFWYDEMGNAVAIGVPRQMFVGKLAKNESDDSVYNVINTESGEVADVIPKAKVPDLRVGTKGVWVVAEVTQDRVWKMVERGELNAFSWRGLTAVSYRVNKDGTTQKVLTDIDLFEVSLVNVPNNAYATAMVAKSVDGQLIAEKSTPQDLIVHVVRIDKTKFQTREKTVEYLKAHNLQHDSIREDDTSFFSLQKGLDLFDKNSLVSVKMADGILVVAGSVVQKTLDPLAVFGVRLTESDVTKMSDLFAKESTMADTNAAVKDAQDKKDEATKKADTSTETKATDANAKTDEEKAKMKPDDKKKDEGKKDADTGAEKKDEQKSDTQKQFELLVGGISQATAKSMSEALTPVFTEFTKTLTAIGTSVQSLAEKMDKTLEAKGETKNETKKDADTNTEKKDEKSKSATTEANPYGEMLATLATLNQRLTETAKTVEVVAKSVPIQPTRDETVQKKETEKGQKTDPNACFDDLWPFAKS